MPHLYLSLGPRHPAIFIIKDKSQEYLLFWSPIRSNRTQELSDRYYFCGGCVFAGHVHVRNCRLGSQHKSFGTPTVGRLDYQQNLSTSVFRWIEYLTKPVTCSILVFGGTSKTPRHQLGFFRFKPHFCCLKKNTKYFFTQVSKNFAFREQSVPSYKYFVFIITIRIVVQ